MNLLDLATKLAEKEYLTQRDAEAAVKLIFRLLLRGAINRLHIVQRKEGRGVIPAQAGYMKILDSGSSPE
jgi:hypothetical protein